MDFVPIFELDRLTSNTFLPSSTLCYLLSYVAAYAGPPTTPSQPASLARTNTRQIGVKHNIELKRGPKGFGFGLTSRDVRTDEQNQPIYVKAVHQGGVAYEDGRLRIGDRILEVRV